MKNDKYIRFILTVIAICLVWICVRDIVVGPTNLFAGNNGKAPSVWVDGGHLDVVVTKAPSAWVEGGHLDVAVTTVSGTALAACEPIQVNQVKFFPEKPVN
jgi:hypothetical protein